MDDLGDVLLELYKEYCRLKAYSLPTKPIEIAIDEATGAQTARMREFSQWLTTQILPRMRQN